MDKSENSPQKFTPTFLCNRYLFDNYRDVHLWLLPCDFIAQLAYQIVCLNPNKEIIEIKPILESFEIEILKAFKNPELPEEFSYFGLETILIRAIKDVPEIQALNRLKPSFIDLDALQRELFYGMIRHSIIESGLIDTKTF